MAHIPSEDTYNVQEYLHVVNKCHSTCANCSVFIAYTLRGHS